MESALCLNCGPLPFLASQPKPFTVSTRRATKPHFSFGNSSLSLSNASRSSHLIGHAFTPITKQKAPSVRASAFPGGGKAALKSLLDVTVYLASSNVDSQEGSTLSLPSRPSFEEVNSLYKKEAMQLLKSGKGDEAEELLQKAIENCEGDPEPAYNLAIALAEILICKGKYDEANDKCLKEQLHPSDGRFPLYKAIICTMLDKMEEAEKWWGQFLLIIDGGFEIPIE